MEKITRLPGMAYMSDAEYEAFISKEKKAYRKRLKTICPSNEMRRQADYIANEPESCEQCLYFANDANGCRIPYTEAYMAAMDINPCYEGVMFHLCKEAEREKIERDEMYDEIDALLEESLSIIHNDLKTIRALTEILIGVIDCGDKLSPLMLRSVRSLNEAVNDTLNEWETADDFDEDDLGDEDYDDDDYTP